MREQPYHFHVKGLRKHVDEAEILEGISPFGKEAEIPREGGGFTGDINDFFWFQSDHHQVVYTLSWEGRGQ
jgi:hypothetical protein